MSDVVSEESGGITLGTLFIDEGFGTLDPETLDDVMGVIDDVVVMIVSSASSVTLSPSSNESLPVFQLRKKAMVPLQQRSKPEGL